MADLRRYIINNAKGMSAKEQAMEHFISNLGYEVSEVDSNVYEVVKSSEHFGGDYLNPIKWEDGMRVVAGYWYTDGDNIWEAIKDGIPSAWEDSEYFDVIG